MYSVISKNLPLMYFWYLEKTVFSEKHVKDLEEWIDHYTEELPPLTNFILPVHSLLIIMIRKYI